MVIVQESPAVLTVLTVASALSNAYLAARNKLQSLCAGHVTATLVVEQPADASAQKVSKRKTELAKLSKLPLKYILEF